MLGVLGRLPDFLFRPRPEGLDLDDTHLDAVLFQERLGLTTLGNRSPRGDDQNLGIGTVHFDQAVQPPDGVFPGSFHRRPDFLLPACMGGITDIVTLHDERVTHHADRRAFHIHARDRRPVRVIGRQAHVRGRQIDYVFGMGHEKPVATQGQRQMHVRLFRHHVPFQNPVIKVLRRLGVPDQHPGVQQVRNFQRVRLDGQRGIDTSTGHNHLNGQPRPGPHRKVLHGTHRARTGGRGEHARAAESRPGALGHHRELAFPAEVVADKPFGKQFTDQRRGFTLRGNRISDHHVAIGPPDGLFDHFTARKKTRRPLGLMHHLPSVRHDLPGSIFCPN